jgi:hypothetical protein
MKPLRTILHSRLNSVMSSSGDAKSRAQTGVEARGALLPNPENITD